MIHVAKKGELTDEERAEAYHLLHRLWGDAKDGDYDKEAWKRFQALVERAIGAIPATENAS